MKERKVKKAKDAYLTVKEAAKKYGRASPEYKKAIEDQAKAVVSFIKNRHVK